MLPQLFCKSTARNQLNKDNTNTHHMSAILPQTFVLYFKETLCLALPLVQALSSQNSMRFEL